ncbi:MAG: TolC family protein [Betaproteobacteria bacterium]|nr:TolC family protein [Betaproteobacteria bacterium]
MPLLAGLASVMVLPSAGMAVDAAPSPGANRTVRTLSLSEVVGLAASRNRDIAIARGAVSAAEADNLAARARPNPALSLGTSGFDPRHPGSGSLFNKPMDSVVQLSQLFERGNKRELRDRITRIGIDAARDDLAETSRRQTLAVSLAFYDLLQAQSRVSIADETIALFAKTVAAARLRLEAGDISPTDLSRIKVDELRAQNERRIAMTDRDRAREVLAYLIGEQAPDVLLAAEDAWPSYAAGAGDESTLDETALDERPDVRAARRRVDAADRARELARALRTRDITVGVQYERYPTQIQNNTIGVGVSLPLFLNYGFEGEVRRSEADRQIALDYLERTRSAALAELRRAGAELTGARDRIRRFDDELLKQAVRAADAAEFAYRNGALGVLDLLDARRVLYATRVDAVDARADYARALASWQAARQQTGSVR